MNRHCYRTVFNAHRSQLMVVPDHAKGRGKGDGSGSGTGERTGENTDEITGAGLLSSTISGLQAALSPAVHAALRPIVLSLYAALGMVSMVAPLATAQATLPVIADPNAPANQRPTVVTSASGVPVVNIQTPSAAGVSRNTYSQFNVGTNGIIINNSRTNAPTHIAGWVQGNPWLATGSARVILNEVNSVNPSQLRGYIEIAGQRAEIVIANAAGIVVDGAGFINASRATLSTGKLNFDAGNNLAGHTVTGGTVTVNGKGLDASLTDYTGILANAVQVNAGIWAKDLHLVLGNNTIALDSVNGSNANGTAVSASAGNTNIAAITSGTGGTGTPPAFALDVSQLGGMYAGKISLIGTQAGVGVNNSGVIAATGGAAGSPAGAISGTGSLTLDSKGWLSNSGTLQSAGNTHIQTTGAIANSGVVYAGANIAIATPSTLTTSGVIAAQDSVNLSAASSNATASSITAAGMAGNGSMSVLANQPTNLPANLTMNTLGANTITGQTISAGDTTITGSSINAASGSIAGNAVSLTATGTSGASSMSDLGSISTAAGHVSATTTLSVNANSQTGSTWNNTGGAVSANQLNATVANLNNTSGSIVQTGTGDLTLRMAQAGNTAPSAAGAANTATGTLSNDGGRIASNSTNLTIQAASISNGAVTNAAGTAVASASGSIEHAGTGTAAITANTLNNASGQILSNGHLNAAVTSGINNQHGVLLAQQLTVAASSLDNRTGQITQLGTGAASITVTGAIDNSASGVIASNGNTTINASSLNNTLGTVQTAGTSQLSINTTGAVNNTDGLLAAGGNLALTVNALDNTRGRASAGNDLTLTATASTATGINNTDGLLAAKRHLTLSANTLDNTRGTIAAVGGNLVATTTGQTLNQAGNIQAAGDLSLTNTGLDNSTVGNANLNTATGTAGLISGNTVTLNTQGHAFNNHLGTVAANTSATLSTGALNNDAGLIQAGTALSIDTQGNTLTNTNANARPNNANGTANNGGIVAGTSLTVTTVNTGNLDNRAGYIGAGGAMTITTAQLDNTALTVGGQTVGGQLMGGIPLTSLLLASIIKAGKSKP